MSETPPAPDHGFDTSDETHPPATESPVALSFDSVKHMTGIGQGEPFADAIVAETPPTPEQLNAQASPEPELAADPEPEIELVPAVEDEPFRDPACVTHHVRNCECRGAERGPLPR